MTAFENVFGKGVQFDAAGKPIERGIGNHHDRAKQAVASAAPQTAPAVGAAPALTPVVATPEVPQQDAAPVADPAHRHSLFEKLKVALAHGEAEAEAEIEKLVADL